MMLDGRPLNIIVAVEREKAESLNADTGKVDKRNLYLIREGMSYAALSRWSKRLVGVLKACRCRSCSGE